MKSLDMSFRFIEEIKDLSPHLTVLNLEGNNLTSMTYLASYLRGNKTLKRLYLAANLIDENGILALLSALTENHTLELLDVRCDLTYNILSILDVVIYLISMNTSLRYLSMNGTGLNSTNNQLLVSALFLNKTLVRVNFHNGFIKKSDVQLMSIHFDLNQRNHEKKIEEDRRIYTLFNLYLPQSEIYVPSSVIDEFLSFISP